MPEDPYFIAQNFKRPGETVVNVNAAVLRQVDEFGKAFEQMDNPYFREQGAEVWDIGRRMIENLMSSQQFPCDLKEPVIIITSSS